MVVSEQLVTGPIVRHCQRSNPMHASNTGPPGKTSEDITLKIVTRDEKSIVTSTIGAGSGD